MAEIKHATDATFEELVLKAERPVVVDFWAAWCGPCKLVAPEMEKLAAKYDGSVDVVKVDVDANPRLSQAFNILSIPTIAFFKPGAQPQGVVGFKPLEQLEQQFGLAEFAVATRRLTRARTIPPPPADGPGSSDRGHRMSGGISSRRRPARHMWMASSRHTSSSAIALGRGSRRCSRSSIRIWSSGWSSSTRVART